LVFPEFAVLADPVGGFLHAARFQPEVVEAAIAPAGDEPDLFEDAQMPGDGGKGNGES